MNSLKKYNAAKISVPLKTSETLYTKAIISTGDYKGAEEIVRQALFKCAVSLGIDDDLTRLKVIAEDVVYANKHESIETILLAIKNGRSGLYGDFYGKLNAIVVTKWVNQLNEERAAEREKVIASKKIKESDKVDIAEDIANNEQTKEYLKRWKESIRSGPVLKGDGIGARLKRNLDNK